MSTFFTGQAEWTHQSPRTRGPKHRSIACVELITTAALAFSTAVAITAVSIGIARADVAGAVVRGDGAPFAIALFIGLLLAGMGGLTAVMADDNAARD
jgi:hypothetical protein